MSIEPSNPEQELSWSEQIDYNDCYEGTGSVRVPTYPVMIIIA